MTVVIDTNVLVSALWNPRGTPAQVLSALYAGMAVPVTTDDILDEYLRVLTYKDLDLPEQEVREMLHWFRRFRLPLPPPRAAHRCIDQDDQKFLDAAVAADADMLVTGNRRHYPAHVPGLLLLAPAAALERLEKAGS